MRGIFVRNPEIEQPSPFASILAHKTGERFINTLRLKPIKAPCKILDHMALSIRPNEYGALPDLSAPNDIKAQKTTNLTEGPMPPNPRILVQGIPSQSTTERGNRWQD
jgi:hypothetical protein